MGLLTLIWISEILDHIGHKLLGFYWWNKGQICCLVAIRKNYAILLLSVKTSPQTSKESGAMIYITGYYRRGDLRPIRISPYCLLAIAFTSALNMLWRNDFDCTPVHNTVWHHVHILFSPSLRVTKQMTLAINCITHTYSQSHSRTYKRDTCF